MGGCGGGAGAIEGLVGVGGGHSGSPDVGRRGGGRYHPPGGKRDALAHE